ncbi:DUF6087 family protein [Streptomyces sp. NPDC015350]|uniref:DUF6087 family protein n=1 Tax=Streptomyces sp. NPDC015350 TaxID=3364955 RepID=UPI0036F8BD6C
MNDDPLDEWAARRDAHRPAPGARRAVPLGEGPARGGHVDPAATRGMLEWDGHQWVPSGVAEDHAAALEETGPQTQRSVFVSRRPVRCPLLRSRGGPLRSSGAPDPTTQRTRPPKGEGRVRL